MDTEKSTEHQIATEAAKTNELKTSDIEPIETTTSGTTGDNPLITSNVNVEALTDVSAHNPTNIATEHTVSITTHSNTDPGPDTINLESNVIEDKNSLLSSKQASVPDTVNKQQQPIQTASDPNDADLSSLDAALDNLTAQVTSLLDENKASNIKSESLEAPLDAALATLNNEVLGLLQESRKIQDELKKANDPQPFGSRSDSRSALNQTPEKNKYFDYSLYRERSTSPPPHPLTTYRWEDVRRDKEKGCYPWTYLNPQDILEATSQQQQQQQQLNDQCEADDQIRCADSTGSTYAATEDIETIQIAEPVVVVPTSLLPELSASPHDLLSFNFDNIDTQRAIDSYSAKSSVKNSSSGILEVLQDLEAEEERENERKRNQVQASTTTQSNQDLSTYKPKEESKRFAFRSLLKRTHSAPKKIQLTKNRPDTTDPDPDQPKSPTQVQCCHPIVEKLKTMADRHVNKSKSAPKKSSKSTVKTVPLPKEKKIVLAEQTRIIRLRDSPKAERKNIAAYLEKRDSDDIVEIVQLDESPSEIRKRREENRKIDDEQDEQGEHDKSKRKENETKNDDNGKDFVVPKNLTGLNTEPTVEELLEEEFKNDPPKKAPRKIKEHIYEEIETPGAITSHVSGKLSKPANVFASAVLHSILNKDEFKDSLKRQNEIEDNEEERLTTEMAAADASVSATTTTMTTAATIETTTEEIIELKTIENKTVETLETDEPNAKDLEPKGNPTSDIEIKIDHAADDDENRGKMDDNNEMDESVSKSDTDPKKDVLLKEERKVKFSQSTEEYQEKLEAEKAPEKEDVELPENIRVSKRWSNMSDHEYEPIGEPSETSKSEQHVLERPVFKITEPEATATDAPKAEETTISIGDDHTGTESPIRSITPFTDISRTEDLHTSQVDDSVIEELPLRREDRKKKSFITNAGEHTKNLQHKISSQASNLRTKFKRSLKPSGRSGGGDGSGGSGFGAHSQKASGPNLKTSLKSSPKTSQTSPRERKKFKSMDFANKLKSIHMPKMSKPELPKFKMPEKFKRSRHESDQTDQTNVVIGTITTEANAEDPSSSVFGTDGKPKVISVKTEEIFETKILPSSSSKKRFEFGSYPKIFARFNKKSDEHDVTDVVSSEQDIERDTATQQSQPSSSSFSTHFATVPRTASKIKNSIISKWNKSNFSRGTDREDNDSIPRGVHMQHDDLVHEDSVERRIRLASKISMEEEEEPLGILQTKDQIQLASYNEENRAIHEISRAREQEFKARKPLTHQDSDLVSEESNRDIDWEEVERLRNKIMGSQQTPSYIDSSAPKKHSGHSSRRPRTDSNFSTEETQSSGSSGDRRRTGVIENIDDDEFFLRQRGVSQDNAEISEYISSAIREGMHDAVAGRQFSSYSYDNNSEVFANDYPRFEEQKPKKPARRRHDGFERNFDLSYDEYQQHADHELPVATQYFSQPDDENLSFYDNDFTDDIDHTNILSRDSHFDSDVDNEGFHSVDVSKPEVPKRRRKVLPKQDSIETNEEIFIFQSEPTTTAALITKPARRNRTISSKSDPATTDNRDSILLETTTIEKISPSNSRFTIDVKETNGYATVKKEPPARPPARRKRSTKSTGSHKFKDSPFPERQTRGTPMRPPRRGSSSSLIDPHKPPSIAPSDGTQYEEIDDELEDDENAFYKMQNRPLPPPPRPPRDKRLRRKSSNTDDKKFDDNDDNAGGIAVGSFDDPESEFSTREFIGAEMATQTSLDISDLYLNEDMPLDTEQYTRTVEEILQSTGDPIQRHSGGGSSRTSDDNLSKGIAKFRESNQRSYSERSRESSRPITPSALVIEQRIARSPHQMDATLIMQPVEDLSKPDLRMDSAESEYVPYADDVDDTQIDTEDERIINAAIRRYQMLGNEILDEHGSSPRSSTPRVPEEQEPEMDEKITIEVPLPPPRRKSSASATQMAETINVPLAEPESLSATSTKDRNPISHEPVNDLSTSTSIQPTQARVESLTVVNIQSANIDEPKESSTTVVNALQITPEVMQEIIERVRETLPTENVIENVVTTDKTVATIKTTASDEPPKRPPTPVDYTPTSEIPPSFYRLRTGISDDESVPSIPPAILPKHRPPRSKHTRHPGSSSDEEYSRRHHHHSHHGSAVATTSRGQDLSIVDLSGLLIRACGRALSSSLSTAGHSVIDFIRSLTKNQDDEHKDLSLVLIILIIIVASLMMLGISGDRSIHHHHHHFMNPPDHFGRQ